VRSLPNEVLAYIRRRRGGNNARLLVALRQAAFHAALSAALVRNVLTHPLERRILAVEERRLGLRVQRAESHTALGSLSAASWCRLCNGGISRVWSDARCLT